MTLTLTVPAEPTPGAMMLARQILVEMGATCHPRSVRALALAFDGVKAGAREAVGREISALGRGLRELREGEIVGFALLDIGSRLESGHPIEDNPGVVNITANVEPR